MTHVVLCNFDIKYHDYFIVYKYLRAVNWTFQMATIMQACYKGICCEDVQCIIAAVSRGAGVLVVMEVIRDIVLSKNTFSIVKHTNKKNVYVSGYMLLKFT